LAPGVLNFIDEQMNSTDRSLLALIANILVAATAGCSTAKFYSQAIHGQAEILRNARPTAVVMRDPKVSGEVRRKLALTQDVRRFARATLRDSERAVIRG
jgi:predicted aminopeptidase